MWEIILKIVFWYLIIGYIQAWRWLIEARIKCVDMRERMWSEYLNSLQGIASFTFLGMLFWLPALLIKLKRWLKKKVGFKTKATMSWFQSLQKAVQLYKELQAWRRNDIE